MSFILECLKDFLTSIGSNRFNSHSLDDRSLWIHSSSFVGNISNITFISISLIVNMLDTTIGKSYRVRSFSITVAITSLSSIEVSVGVVIIDSIGVSIGRGLIRVNWGSMSNSMNNWSSMNNRGSVNNGGSMNNWCCMNKRGSMNDWSMDSMGSDRNNSCMSDSNWPSSTESWLDFRKTL